MPNQRLRVALFGLFAVSGFTGLIYESIWSHYLKLFLGHAAYAQALVLAIFMGGMALGAWATSKQVAKWSNLLMWYAIVEGAIGFLGVIFHVVFIFVTDISFDSVIPALDSVITVHLYKWSVATLLILPQSILLGMTFPLMSNGIIRHFPDFPGKTLSMLYFTNSLGAAAGVLVSGFVLIAAVGLPGTILFAAIINILLAVVVYGIARKLVAPSMIKSLNNIDIPHISLLFLIAAFVTAVASFIYEIAWIRMLSMVLGSSTHSFELMLSTFIAGLALGGLFIRRYIDRLTNPILTAGIIQIIMGFSALATVPLYNFTFDLMGLFMSALKANDQGYILYTLASHFIVALVMLPATICAGMTLPLFTKILLEQGYGEKSVGQIYASNTLGAIVGVVITIFFSMPVFGLKNTMVLGSGLDIFLGIVLLSYSRACLNKKLFAAINVLILACYSASLFLHFDFRRMSSTVYRTGIAVRTDDSSILYQKDGKTASIHVIRRPDGLVTITTNGKPDASINMNDDDSMGPDEQTMVLTAAIPLSIFPEVRTVANIGMGSGLTTHTLLSWPGIESVDTIEIESAMVEGASYFLPRVNRVFSDERSNIHIEDAKTFFSTNQKKYDLITSEPSNPWVSGVSSLFTDEFYSQIKNYLNHNGLFVQWLQTYEISIELVLSILNSLDKNFNYYALYAINDGDLVFLANNDSPIDMPKDIIFNSENMRKELELVRIYDIQDIKIRYIADERLIKPLLKVYNPFLNSDFFPYLDLNAPEARFKQNNAYELTRLRSDPVPVVNMLIPDIVNIQNTNVSIGNLFTTTKKVVEAKYIYDYVVHEKKTNPEYDYSDYYFLVQLKDKCSNPDEVEHWNRKLVELAKDTVPFLSPEELKNIWTKMTPACPDTVDNSQISWINFFIALSQNDAQAIADRAAALLNSNNKVVQEQRKILMGSLFLALVKLDELHAANIIWKQLLNGPFNNGDIPLSLKILYGLMLNKQ